MLDSSRHMHTQASLTPHFALTRHLTHTQVLKEMRVKGALVEHKEVRVRERVCVCVRERERERKCVSVRL